ncbi:MAG: endonuclease III [Planctomycetales bacterium]|nr:endonuclease III [Planctomycetales bacterium]
MMAKTGDQRRFAAQIVRRLQRDYPDAECALRYDSPLQLLVATILSAQCTDERVNMVTEGLFDKYPTADALANLPLKTLEQEIQSTGFFRNKAKNIQACCQQLVRYYGGEVPQQMEKLVELPGVGRKTANVVLGTAFGVASGVVVDTHVGRISQRLGLTDKQDAVKAEQDLMTILPRKEWIDFSHRMIHHGRKICKARKPLCEQCGMSDICPRIGVS